MNDQKRQEEICDGKYVKWSTWDKALITAETILLGLVTGSVAWALHVESTTSTITVKQEQQEKINADLTNKIETKLDILLRKSATK